MVGKAIGPGVSWGFYPEPAPARNLMALTISLPSGLTAKCVGLEVWMDRAVERARKVAPGWRDDDVHDLRVALRRCRTMADALREVNPGPGWRKLRKSTRDLFRVLGDLRDAQVERGWIKRLSEPGDPGRKYMLRLLGRQGKRHRKAAAEALDAFDAKQWRSLARKLAPKAHFFPLESVVFQRLALAKLNEAAALHRRALRKPSMAAWHEVRIGLKEFRYIVENFLPQRYELWSASLKEAQDLLGDAHDLDVLESEIRRNTEEIGEAASAQWCEKIAAERNRHLAKYLAAAENSYSIWEKWRTGFHAGQAIAATAFPARKTA